jgi:hypothetical protein
MNKYTNMYIYIVMYTCIYISHIYTYRCIYICKYMYIDKYIYMKKSRAPALRRTARTAPVGGFGFQVLYVHIYISYIDI